MESKFKVGDKVRIDEAWGSPQGGKICKVLAINYGMKCESGVMILTSIYAYPLDSNWLSKIGNK